MRITCLGGGPGGLYFSILMKLAAPSHEITVHERHAPDDTYGWGVVFSDEMLDVLAAADPPSHAEILRSLRRWNDCAIHFKGRRIVSGGHGFSGIGRQRLLDILQRRAAALGVILKFGSEIGDDAEHPEIAASDLIVAADGAHSAMRQRYENHFKPIAEKRKCRYVWLAARLSLDAFTFITEPSEWGWFQAHVYPFDEETSTFIVECREETWRAAGLDRLDAPGTLAFCERIFAAHLNGASLLANPRHTRGSAWLNFNRLSCRHWYCDNRVLLGDAAHTLHFSIGSGTRLAIEDAIALSEVLGADDNDSNSANIDRLSAALQRYQDRRSGELLKLQNAARNRMEWFENLARYTHLEAEQFAYALLTSSQRLGHDNLRRRDAAYIDGVETWLAAHSGAVKPPGQPLPPMFTPFRLRGLTLRNRVVVSPMAMYSCEDDGIPGDFHLAHLGSRALGGAGLIMTEMTAVSPDGRITPRCAGLWQQRQVEAWRRIVDFVHRTPGACIGAQLGHAGPKGSTRPGWEGHDRPLAQGNWPLIAPSAAPYGPESQTPRAMTQADMAAVRDAFAAAAHRAAQAGFDLLELHCAHGYLLSSFICPLTNRRDDDYGGCLENRLRFPLEVCRAVRIAWPHEKPLAVRISAHDWAPGGNTDDDAVTMARAFRDAGADLIDVSSGQTTLAAQPTYGRMYQTPFADRVRNEARIATMAVGNIFEADHVNTIVAAGRADLCAIGRPHLADAAWTLRAAAQQGYARIPWPPQYLGGRQTLERLHAGPPPPTA